MTYPSVDDIARAHARAKEKLLSEIASHGHCKGRLSSSALATAIAVFALAKVDRREYDAVIREGLDWVVADINDDGGWGDSPESPSNVSATTLCWAALSLTETDTPMHAAASRRGEAWLASHAGGTRPADIAAAIAARYGNDRTFASPILTMSVLSGRMGNGRDAWDVVPQLPFELSAFPKKLFGLLRMTVVSYALPALIAIGLVRHRHRPSSNPMLRRIRDWWTPRAVAIAERMQPSNGGYEEATPLTGFVTMSLACAGEEDTPLIRKAVSFLMSSVREDGSWPIDTDLATWLTNLSIPALDERVRDDALAGDTRSGIREWLLAQQYDEPHPLTFGAPGGWAWTDLPGGMPDADDTSGALIALRMLADVDERALVAAERGIGWLLDLQNRDGGIPTFSRGWGRLPFDRSCPDITAHTIHAFAEWLGDIGSALRARVQSATPDAMRYLRRSQRDDGSWVPLWFGNQFAPGEENPTYGTCRVVIALRALEGRGDFGMDDLVESGEQWLVSAQNEDGGWGGAHRARSSVEETALAVTALCGSDAHQAVRSGTRWLLGATDGGSRIPAAPIGLYFAKLWYSEELYPVIFLVWALGRVLQLKRDALPGGC